jgi:predicted RecA/RadA family phage recombinase
MANNFISDGRVLQLTVPSGGVVGGTPLLIGSILVVPVGTDATQNDLFAGISRGVLDLAKATGETWAEGDRVYWDNSAKKVTKTAASNTPIGFAVQVQASGDTTGRLLLLPMPGGADDVAAVATANATDLTTSEALANQLKTTVNAILTSLKNAGVMA